MRDSPRRRDRGAIAAGLTVGCFVTWNVSNVGADAEPLADAYGVSLAVIGLLTAALFVTHLAAQLPAGIWSDRAGPHRVAVAACAAVAAGNALLLVDAEIGLAVVGRLVVGLGSGAGFVAGLDLVRAGGAGAVLHGAYGGATMAGGGLALVVVPPLTVATSWRAAYASALLLALVAMAAAAFVRGLTPVGRSARGVVRDPRLLPLGALQAATFGLAVVAGNWVVPLLEHEGEGAAVAGALGGLVLLAGIVTRPLGGSLVHHRPRQRDVLLAGSLAAVALGALLLALGGPVWLSGLGALALGLAAGLPFAAIFEAAQRLRPDAPGAAVALVNACGVFAVLVGTPLAGLAFDLPGEGALAFAGIAVLAAAAVPFARRLPPPAAGDAGEDHDDRGY
jgi:MFS transporter, NNP family, nitrate/nitrite transporter